VVYGIGRIDAPGRVWLTLTASAGVMVARRGPDGMITVPGWPHIVIPAAVGAAAGGSELE
jgi:hypothetical protein